MTLALFLYPDVLPLVALAPLAWLLLGLLDRVRAARLLRFAGVRRRALAGEGGRRRRLVRQALFGLALLIALLAVAGPLATPAAGALEWRGADVVVALDVSRSMLAGDLPPTRLAHAKREIAELAEQARGDRLALVVFAGEARLVVPLTLDAHAFALLAGLADPADVKVGGTDLGVALQAAGRALEPREPAPAAVILLTDGEDLEGRGLEVAERLGARDVPVYAVGFGTALGSKIAIHGPAGETFLRDRSGAEVVSRMDARDLRRIAEATGGAFVDARAEPHALVTLYRDEILPQARAAVASEEAGGLESRYQLFLLAALLLWLVDLAIPRRRRMRPLRPVVPASAHAGAPRVVAVFLVLPLLLTGCDATSDGRAAWEAGRYDDAYRAFDRAVRDAGDDASPELLYDRALAALRAGDLGESERSARDAAAVAEGDATIGGLGAFVRGNVAFARSRAAALEVAGRRNDPRAMLPAVKLAEDALAAWQWAAASRAEWPEARRNVERALLWLDLLREKRGGAGKPPPGKEPGTPPEPQPPKPPKPPEPQPPPAPPPPEEAPPPARPPLEEKELDPRRVLGLLEVLRRKEQEKQDLRRARRHARASDVERDW